MDMRVGGSTEISPIIGPLLGLAATGVGAVTGSTALVGFGLAAMAGSRWPAARTALGAAIVLAAIARLGAGAAVGSTVPGLLAGAVGLALGWWGLGGLLVVGALGAFAAPWADGVAGITIGALVVGLARADRRAAAPPSCGGGDCCSNGPTA